MRQPRVRDRGDGAIRFTSAILPRYLRRAKSLEDLLPWLYLKGISTGDFGEALAALLGSSAPGLSASTITRLKEVWGVEAERWQRRDLTAKRYVYFWVDGIYFSARMEEEKQCILVIVGATDKGQKELIAIADGYRESEQSWLEVLLDLKRRGLEMGPQLALGDGALGFWKALRQVYPGAREQRCWVHKTGHCCPVKNRINSIGWLFAKRCICFRLPQVLDVWAFSRRGSPRGSVTKCRARRPGRGAS